MIPAPIQKKKSWSYAIGLDSQIGNDLANFGKVHDNMRPIRAKRMWRYVEIDRSLYLSAISIFAIVTALDAASHRSTPI
jgi:hypothetical protein